MLGDIYVSMKGKEGEQELGGGVEAVPRLGKTGEFIFSQAHGKYYEAASRGRLFYSHSVARAMSAPSTSAIGNIVWNPPGSGVNLSFCLASFIIIVVDGDAVNVDVCYSVQATVPGSVTVATSGPCLLGPVGVSSGKAKAYSIATVTTAPTPILSLGEVGDAVLSVGTTLNTTDLDGMIVCPPGYLVSLHTVVAAGTAGMTSDLVWEEVPIV